MINCFFCYLFLFSFTSLQKQPQSNSNFTNISNNKPPQTSILECNRETQFMNCISLFLLLFFLPSSFPSNHVHSSINHRWSDHQYAVLSWLGYRIDCHQRIKVPSTHLPFRFHHLPIYFLLDVLPHPGNLHGRQFYRILVWWFLSSLSARGISFFSYKRSLWHISSHLSSSRD